MEERTPEELTELLAAAAGGDDDAWRAIVETYLPKVHAVVRSQCRDPELAEEITQSTFCTIVSKLSNYQEVGRFESWLLRIAMNRLRDEMRRRKRHAVPTEESTLVGLAGAEKRDQEGPDAELGRRILAGVNRLPDSDREILFLRHVSGLSFKELSEALGAPVGTLLARHHRALKKLKTLLEADGELSGEMS